jgi:hypothetical protein
MELLERGPAVTRPLPMKNNMNIDKHASSGIGTHISSVFAVKDVARLRLQYWQKFH